MNRSELRPSSALPLVYFACAHVGLGLACLALVLDPSLPGGYFLHPRMAAIVHLVTIGWISGSILGAFYIVAPLALGMPLPVRLGDWLACTAFVAGTIGMVWHLWTGQYGVMAWAGAVVLAPVILVGGRAALGVRSATAPWPVVLHVMLAFTNMAAAALLGGAIGLDRAHGVFGLAPSAAALAHLHLAVIGWPLMMVVGLAYRLVPMFLPAKMPTGAGLALSAVCLECGLVMIVVRLLLGGVGVVFGALFILAGLAAFVQNMRAAVKQKLPRPPALPSRDWSTWQTHVAIVWLLVAAVLGTTMTVLPAGSAHVHLAWLYGAAGLIGFVAQIVVGIQGRLVPLYAWYRAMAALGGRPPARAANALPTPAFARPIFLLWSTGVPVLAWGLAFGHSGAIRSAALVLLAAVVTGAAYLRYLMRAARPWVNHRDVASME